MLISVHVPKTGGKSFRSILQAHFKDRLLVDHSDRPMSKDTKTRTRQAEAHRLRAEDPSDRYDCIHGHFLPAKWAIPGQNNIFAVWLRDPAQRIVSRYHYAKRTSEGRLPEGMSLEEFCALEHYQNLYAKYLWNFELENFSFVGITENYDNSVEIFVRQFKIAPVTLEIGHRNPEKEISAPYEISPELRELIHQSNRQDYDIYREAVEINHRLEREYLGDSRVDR